MPFTDYFEYPMIDHGSEPPPFYFIEFSRVEEGHPLRWRMFMRNFINEAKEINNHPLMSNEIHPWQIGNGIVNEREGAMDMNTISFLQFIIDSMNKCHQKNP